jgi:mxaJ protein
MTSRCRERALWLCAALLGAWVFGRPPARAVETGREVLRVCADPNNLPFSNERGEGFENRLVERLAESLGLRVQYTWWPQRRGFLRNTLLRGACDVVPGLPTASERVAVTAPYYRSTYVFLYRRSLEPKPHSLDEPALRRLRIGVQLVGDDGANSPPAHALSRRGITRNLHGYLVMGDYAQSDPPARIVEAVARDEIDVAIVWGPLAGYFAPRQPAVLEWAPVQPQIDVPFLPFVFDVSMAVRPGDDALRAQLERFLRAQRGEVDALLAQYGVPRVDRTDPARGAAGAP